MNTLELRCFGSFTATVGSERVESFRSQKERALLAYLAVERGRRHPRAQLSSLLWPGTARSDARRNLRLTLHRLRSRLEAAGLPEDLLGASRSHVRLDPDRTQVDVQRFEERIRPCSDPACLGPHVCADCELRLHEAVHLYRGDFLQDLRLDDTQGFTEWTVVTRERLQRRAIGVMYRMAENYRRRGDLENARALAERQLELTPWREEAHRQLIGLLARAGERTAALEQFEVCKRELRRHLDVAPESATQALVERVRSLHATPPPPLPRPSTRMIGRQQELADLSRQLARPEVRLLTITGPGGVGKTRLALELARRTRRAYLDGVYFVQLSGARAASDFWSGLISELNLDAHSALHPHAQIKDFLRAQESMLVMDSYEGLLPHVEPLAEILEQAPLVKILVTSQSPLLLKQEHTFPLEGLEWEPDDHPDDDRLPAAARFFVNTVRSQQPTWTPDLRAEHAILEICRRLRGLPLGIELAAAAYPERTLDDIQSAVSEEPDALGPLHGAPARQRSLQAVYEHAVKRLQPEARAALARLSVLESPFHVEAALETAATDRSTLSALQRAALIHVDGEERVSLHGSIRAFARDELEEVPRVEEAAFAAHVGYYLDQLTDSLSKLRDPAQDSALQALDLAWPNLRAAWGRAARQCQFNKLATAGLGLAQFCTLRGRAQEGAEMLSTALASAESDGCDPTPSQLALLRLAYSQALNDVGRFSQAEQQLLRALPHLTGQERAFALCVRARAATRQGRNLEAIRWAEQAAGWSEAHGDPWGRALALHQRSLAHWEHAPLQEVLEVQRAAHEAAQEAGDPHLLHLTQNNLAASLRKRGEYGRARELLTPLIDDQGQTNHSGKLIWPLINLGTLEKVEGNLEQAKLLLRRALDLALAKGAQHQAARARYCLAYALLAADELNAARRDTSTALEIMTRLDDKAGLASAHILMGEILEQQGELEAADREFRVAADLSDELGFTYGRTVVPVRRALLAIRRGDPDTAAGNLSRGLKLSSEFGPESVRQLALAGAARLLAEQDDGTAASAWLEAMRTSPEVAPHVRQEIETWDISRYDGDPPISARQVSPLDQIGPEIEARLASFVEGT